MCIRDSICIRLGFTKKRVLPEPEPPMTRMFLFLAYFGCFGRLFNAEFRRISPIGYNES